MPDESNITQPAELKSLLDPAIESFRRSIESQLQAKCVEWVEHELREKQRETERKARTDAAESLLEATRRIRLEQSFREILNRRCGRRGPALTNWPGHYMHMYTERGRGDVLKNQVNWRYLWVWR